MKKFFYLLFLGGMLLSSCDLSNATDDTDPNNNNNNNNNSDDAQSFSVGLTYTSTSPSTDKASLDINTLTAVPANQGDVTLCWQSQFGYVITSPDGSIIKEIYDINTVSYSNNKTTTIQNLGQVDLANYDQLSELKALTVTSGSIPNYPKNQVQVNAGDVIAFQRGDIKGVAKLSGLSKVTKKITLTGYVYNPSNSSSTK